MNPRSRRGIVALFSVSMGWLEAAVVVYLRVLVGRLQPYQADPLPAVGGLGEIELVREAATLAMLAAVGWLAGSTWRSRLGFGLLAFGIWDLAYYAFLRVLTGWPETLLDWDLLFLLPLPWWGPVLAPLLVAGLLAVGGSTLATQDRDGAALWPRRRPMLSAALGVVLILTTFMLDALRALPDGPQAVRSVLPARFSWLPFVLGLGLMALPLLDLIRQLRNRRQSTGTLSQRQLRAGPFEYSPK